MPLALIIIDHGSVRRILTDKNRVAIGPPTLALDALLDWPRRNESNILLQQIGSQRSQRGDVVHYPDPAPVRGEHQIVVPRVNRQIANGNGRKIVALELRPASSAIDRNPESEFRADQKEISLHQIFFNHVRVPTNALRILSSDERRPGLAEIRGLVNVRRHVPESMAIKRGVSRAGIKVTGLHPVHPRVLRQPGNVTNDVSPGFT